MATLEISNELVRRGVASVDENGNLVIKKGEMSNFVSIIADAMRKELSSRVETYSEDEIIASIDFKSPLSVSNDEAIECAGFNRGVEACLVDLALLIGEVETGQFRFV